MSRLILAAEIGYRDVSVSPIATGTVYLGSETFITKPTDTLANTYFAGRLDGDVSYRVRLQTAFWGGESSIAIGSVEVINDDGEYDSWLAHEWRDQAIVIKQHTSGVTYNSATVLLNAIVERLDVVDEKRLRFIIRDPAAALVVPLTTAVYDNTTDAEGVLKPIPFGQPELVKPILIDEATLEYHCSDALLQQIVEVYDQGVPVDFNPVDYGFRLVTAPTGKITATILTSGTGDDPTLTLSPTEYLISGSGRSIEMFNDGNSPIASLDYAMAAISQSRASADGGKYYFEFVVADIDVPASTKSELTKGDSAFEVTGGITNTAIVNPQDPKDAGFYCFAINNTYAAGSIISVYYAYNNDVESDTHSDIGHNSYGDVIGVKVDFDSMEITYLRNNSAFDAVTGPWSIAAGTYTPTVGAADSFPGFGYGSVASIRLKESDFSYAIPATYSAWSSGITVDTTFSEFTASITSRLASVAFDSTSSTAIDALSHSSPLTPYTYSYYVDQSMTGAKLLSWWASSVGGYWFVNRIGEIQVGQLTAPATSVRTIDDTQIIGDISIAPDYAKGLSNGAGAKRNWSPYRESEVSGTATEVFKQQITRDYQSEYRSTTAMATGYAHADGAEMPMSLLSNAVAAQVEADRLAALYAVERKFYSVPIAMDSVLFDNALDEIGETYTLESDRFGLGAGLDCVLVGVDGGFLDNTLTLTLWGEAGVITSNVMNGGDNVINGSDNVVNS